MKAEEYNSMQRLTSAIIPTHPAMTAAFAWAPLIPPRPDVTKTLPDRFSTPKYRRPALSTVSYSEKYRDCSTFIVSYTCICV